MITVYKASAGSGKTFNLVKEYLKRNYVMVVDTIITNGNVVALIVAGESQSAAVDAFNALFA